MTETEVSQSDMIVGRRPQAKECKQPLKAAKGKEISSPLEPPEDDG
jgi:hypothetical protein